MKEQRRYHLIYIRWDEKADRGFDACHAFDAATDDEARREARKHLQGKRTSGPVFLKVYTSRMVKFR